MAPIDSANLSRWFDAYCPSLVLYARQLLPAGWAEDVVQDVFVRLVAQRAAPENVKAWLFRAVRNAGVSSLRSRRRRRQRERRRAHGRQEAFETRGDELIDAKEAQAALESLPGQQREIVVLRIWADMTWADIAAVLGQPLTTVHRHYHDGLASIRKRMESPCNTKRT